MGGKRQKAPAALLGTFGRYVDYRRQQENLTIRQLAARAGMAHSNVFEFVQLKKDPRLSELLKFARAFNQPLAEFLRPFLEATENDNEHSSDRSA